MSFEVVVPALVFRTPDNRLDLDLTRTYAERAAGTWADQFILSGSTALGDRLTPMERARILDLWCGVLERSRLLAFCWCREDIEQAEHRKILPLVVMHNLHDHAQACSFFAGLPEGAFVYSNPKFTSTPFNPALAAAASRAESWSGRAEDALPGCPVRHPPPPLRTVRSARIPVVPRLPGNGRDPTVGGPQALTKYGLPSGHILTQADATAPES